MAKKRKTLSFEEALTELSGVVDELNKVDITLEELLAKYTEGVELYKQCVEQLDSGEAAINKIILDNGADFEESELEFKGE